MNDVIYDIECYSNVFSCVIYDPFDETYSTFEISERKNDFGVLVQVIKGLRLIGARMVGFNNLGYDYPVLHKLLEFYAVAPEADWRMVTEHARLKSDAIINCPFDDRFAHIIWPKDQVVPQVDLFKIHHFDNAARATSLKKLEFAMRADNVGDLPFGVHHELDPVEIDELLRYNKHDVEQTFQFYNETILALEFRKELGDKMGRDFTNHNDTKIGKDIFVIELEKALGKDICFEWRDGKRKPRQSPRSSIRISQIILPYIEFERPEFDSVLRWFKRQTIRETKGVFTEIPFVGLRDMLYHTNTKKVKGLLKNVNVIFDGIQFDFGTGGLHACCEPGVYESDDEYVIKDIDFTSYYPSLAIENTIYPEHLGPEFCDIYDELKIRRVSYDKGTPENAALKLALNGVYGFSNNHYSPFYDPRYTMTITINGQLLLCSLSEKVMAIPGVKFIQANTDGITVMVPRHKEEEFNKVQRDFEELTQLQLEEVEYSRFFVRDVNSYIAEYQDGSLKRKGAYEYEIGWHQNHSTLVVPKAAEAALVRGEDIEEFIRNHDDPYDFYILGQCDRNSKLVLVDGDEETELQRVNRYYASVNGGHLIKIMPPLPRKITKKITDHWKKLGVAFQQDDLDLIAKRMKNKEHIEVEDLPRDWTETDRDVVATALEPCQPRWRRIEQCKDSKVTIHNTVDRLVDVNFDYYINEATKLVKKITR